ncbi:MAG: hypothetical protein ACK5QI_05440, partial [Alphaproteobacteria bacterium]
YKGAHVSETGCSARLHTAHAALEEFHRAMGLAGVNFTPVAELAAPSAPKFAFNPVGCKPAAQIT